MSGYPNQARPDGSKCIIVSRRLLSLDHWHHTMNSYPIEVSRDLSDGVRQSTAMVLPYSYATLLTPVPLPPPTADVHQRPGHGTYASK